MKGKPTLEALEVFRNGGSDIVEAAGVAKVPVISPKPVPTPSERVNKTIRLRKDLEAKLKEDSYRRSSTGERRVTESDIIEEALGQYFATVR